MRVKMQSTGEILKQLSIINTQVAHRKGNHFASDAGTNMPIGSKISRMGDYHRKDKPSWAIICTVLSLLLTNIKETSPPHPLQSSSWPSIFLYNIFELQALATISRLPHIRTFAAELRFVNDCTHNVFSPVSSIIRSSAFTPSLTLFGMKSPFTMRAG